MFHLSRLINTGPGHPVTEQLPLLENSLNDMWASEKVMSKILISSSSPSIDIRDFSQLYTTVWVHKGFRWGMQRTLMTTQMLPAVRYQVSLYHMERPASSMYFYVLQYSVSLFKWSIKASMLKLRLFKHLSKKKTDNLSHPPFKVIYFQGRKGEIIPSPLTVYGV